MIIFFEIPFLLKLKNNIYTEGGKIIINMSNLANTVKPEKIIEAIKLESPPQKWNLRPK